MKQKIILFLNIAVFIGFLMIIFGGIMLKVVPNGNEKLFCAVILSGLSLFLISVLTVNFMTEAMYECPECKAHFDIPKGELTLKSHPRDWTALLTCPKCKKTNLCRKKRILKSNNK